MGIPGVLKAILVVLLSTGLATCGRPPSLLEEIMALGELRVITRNSPTTFYAGANGPEGLEYELAKGFASFLGVELKILTGDRFTDLIPTVESGRAHMAAAGLAVTSERAARVDFGPVYDEVKQYVIYKLGSGRPRNLADLQGKKFEVVSGTSHAEKLQQIQTVRPELIWTENPNTDLTELLLDVATQEIDYTVADSNLFRIYQNFLPEIRVGFELDVHDALAWAFPKRNDDSLIERAEQYFAIVKQNGELERLADRYYGQLQRFDYVGTRQFIRDYSNELPRFRNLFETTASERDMDWRLLAAIGYQESHWDPMAVSGTGVRGIMMLTHNTAALIGIEDRIDPTQSIKGGAEYLALIRRRLPVEITEPDRTWFALAAYNVGYGHLMDARAITRKQGMDPNLWVNVNKSLPLLAKPQWHKKTRHGYARGWEPVKYVENVRNYYDILIWLTSRSNNDLQPVQAQRTTKKNGVSPHFSQTTPIG